MKKTLEILRLIAYYVLLFVKKKPVLNEKKFISSKLIEIKTKKKSLLLKILRKNTTKKTIKSYQT